MRAVAHCSLAQVVPAISNAPSPTPTSTKAVKLLSPSPQLSSALGSSYNDNITSFQVSIDTNIFPTSRRRAALALTGAFMGLTIIGSTDSALAGKRAPPPPPAEKKDFSVSGVQAKVLASKKRKEAMKQAMAKERERGKLVDEKASAQSPPIEAPTSLSD